ncbi:FKBP-type peptidyl-prolyl cis-trans isomerase [Meiothermus sp. QL-1]|uniref:FKBP-type peptidyl-prolyl cis-trans isomerase n=1 Tax=Meiothermus sp. QL-1 TaxID=2058095 RepID=UPI000E0ADB6A|nr:FKBP-type peptidyl-prolyl cis-trans isomerase [Meiothermus sp. QL-1]RDI96301.1 FKBP-type peptidyl-prolyl cis-trans isomerase [Meiothermus sp. QL-1]
MRRYLLLAGVVLALGAGAYFLLGQRQAAGGLCARPPAAAAGLTNEGITTLRLEDLKEGQGPQAITSNTVRVHYIGRLVDGTEFDSSCRPGRTPFEFTLGAGQVIPGWDSGLVGMRAGGQRRLFIPAHLAYGERSPSPNIPPNSALIFDVELLEIR